MLRPQQKVFLDLMVVTGCQFGMKNLDIYGRREMERIEVSNFAMTPFLDWRLKIDTMNQQKGWHPAAFYL